ncbi:MAG: hypothetical protein BM485_06030 [Desulfobulbaceae bacterium DB1]|nr:MAG: hypothetical protein BM485_06030 [Desulfobulbaceae bacterium DB1]
MKNKGFAICACCCLLLSWGGLCRAMEVSENGKNEISAKHPAEEPAMAAIPSAEKDQAVAGTEEIPVVIPPTEPEMAAIPGK